MKEELSLQSLYAMIQEKADKTHTHSFMGSIESALYLNGIKHDQFARLDLKDQKIKTNYDNTSLAIASKNTDIVLKAGNNKSRLEINNQDLEVNNLTISGNNNTDIIVNVVGELLVNNSRVITVNDKNEITGIDLESILNNKKEIVISKVEPSEKTPNLVWFEIEDANEVADGSALGNSQLYTLPVGSIIKTIAMTAPNGYIKADGRLVSRVTYKKLWNYVKGQSTVLTEEEWGKQYTDNGKEVQAYSFGDKSLTFRVPNLQTHDNTTYLIKAYDDISVKEGIQLEELEERLTALENNQISTGIGFVKFADGGMIQYGVAVGNTCNFSTNFVNTDYSIITNYEGNLLNVDINIVKKEVNKCTFNVTNSSGISLTVAQFNYVAVGRWKN